MEQGTLTEKEWLVVELLTNLSTMHVSEQYHSNSSNRISSNSDSIQPPVKQCEPYFTSQFQIKLLQMPDGFSNIVFPYLKVMSPTPKKCTRAKPKPKSKSRCRRFTDTQRYELDKLFSTNMNPSIDTRQKLAKKLKLPLKSVNDWFSHKRLQSIRNEEKEWTEYKN